MIETWKPIFGGAYSVSSSGRIRREISRASGKAGSIMRPIVGAHGYLYVQLSNGADRRRESVHSLVASAFMGPRPAGWEVNHINADRADNREVNLEYVTHQANVQHASMLGNLRGSGVRGERQGSAKLTEASVREIRAARARGITLKALAAQYGVTFAAVRHAAVGITWAHIPREEVA